MNFSKAKPQVTWFMIPAKFIMKPARPLRYAASRGTGICEKSAQNP